MFIVTMPAIVKCIFKFARTRRILNAYRNFSLSSQSFYKVSVLGAAGGVGQPLSLLLKQNSKVSQLALYGLQNYVYGVATDLSHVDTAAQVTGHCGMEELNQCLLESDVVVIPASTPFQAGMTRDDQFITNASIVAELSKACASFCPSAFICIISNPINSLVPVCTKIFERCGVTDTNKIFGVTTIDSIRASTILSQEKELDIKSCAVPVIGGHDEKTIVPLLSQISPPVELNFYELKSITRKIQEASSDIVKAKSGTASATLSVAHAAAKFVNSVLDAIEGKKNIVETAYVRTNSTLTLYFSTQFVLGPNGVERNLGLGSINFFERNLVDKCLSDLVTDIKKGEEYAEKYPI